MIEEENRREIYQRTIKQGIFKEGFDKLLVNVARPIAKGMRPMMQKLHPNIDFLNPVIEAGLEMATLNIIAEVLQASGSLADKIPGIELDTEDAEERLIAMAGAMRAYSGQKFGDKAGEFSILFLPMVKTFIQHSALLSKADAAPAKALNPKNPNLIELLDIDSE
jgi:hypothetical protein